MMNFPLRKICAGNYTAHNNQVRYYLTQGQRGWYISGRRGRMVVADLKVDTFTMGRLLLAKLAQADAPWRSHDDFLLQAFENASD